MRLATIGLAAALALANASAFAQGVGSVRGGMTGMSRGTGFSANIDAGGITAAANSTLNPSGNSFINTSPSGSTLGPTSPGGR